MQGLCSELCKGSALDPSEPFWKKVLETPKTLKRYWHGAKISTFFARSEVLDFVSLKQKSEIAICMQAYDSYFAFLFACLGRCKESGLAGNCLEGCGGARERRIRWSEGSVKVTYRKEVCQLYIKDEFPKRKSTRKKFDYIRRGVL